MTARWRLPDALGGGEYEPLTSFNSKAGNDWRVRFSIPDVGLVDIPMEALTEVKPPQPTEPPNFSTVRVGARAYVRDDNASHLSWVGPDGRREWSELCRIADEKTGFPPVLLVPAPMPVEMPWRGAEQYGNAIVIDRYDATSVSVVLAGRATAWLPLDAAVDAAHALLAAVEAQP